MECEDTNDLSSSKRTDDVSLSSAVNSSILNYYKKFGRKRDLEQYFSLSTAQSDLRDPNGSFWNRMKQQNYSSDSGEKKSDSSTELCRISIRCTVPEPSTSQDEKDKRTPDSDSPPIITEDVDHTSKHSDEVEKSDDDHSQKSGDATFDTSMNKPFSPTSSVTSQRKLEWDSLADVGYGNESGRKTSGSSLSTLERLALKQQYSNNDSKDLGLPTAHSTPLEQIEEKYKVKRPTSRTTKIHRKDVDLIEVNMPHCSNKISPQAISVNLTKHISFNVDKSGGVVTVEDKNTETKFEKESTATEAPLVKLDRDSQTSLKKTSEKGSVTEVHHPPEEQQVTVPLSLNTLRRRNRKKRALRRKSNTRVKSRANKENEPVKQKSVDQVSEAESFEYMPGHIYNQNQQKKEDTKTSSNVGNKSSLESSGNFTTDSSKISKVSFSRDLEKTFKLLKDVLKGHCDDKDLKKKLVKSVVQRLLDSQYKDDDSSTDFLSGLSYSSKKIGLRALHHTTTSTSDNTDEKVKVPKKSILRVDKFDPNIIASSSQSAPNLPTMSKQDIPVVCSLGKPNLTTTTESESSKEKEPSTSPKASSEELYQKYLQALHREAAYKKHLKEKENLLRQKLVGSDNSLKPEARVHNRIKELMKDLTRNNYDDGSGDASKLEGGSSSNPNIEEHAIRNQRSHSVFTLNSSGASVNLKQKWNLKKKLKSEMRHSDPCNKDPPCTSSSKGIYYKVEVTDSSVQVDLQGSDEIIPSIPVPDLEPIMESSKNIAHIVSDEATGDVKYVCLCPSDTKNNKTIPDNILIYKCSRISAVPQASEASGTFIEKELKNTEFSQPSTSKKCDDEAYKLQEKSSQTDFHRDRIGNPSEPEKPNLLPLILPNVVTIEEATRCLQTEITIDPNLVEPTLSDVNFVKDEDCAVLVSEQYKIPKAVTELICEDDSKLSLTGTSKSGIKKILQQEQQSDEAFSNFTQPSGSKNHPDQLRTQSVSSVDTKTDNNEIVQPVCRKDNIAIPIEGTNMTLMVTFSADARPDMGVQSQGTITHKPEVSEKTTSIFEECTKSVQSQSTELFKKIDKFTTGRKTNNSSNEKQRLLKTEKFNTHPKVDFFNDRKLFFRSNTDPSLSCANQAINFPVHQNIVDSSSYFPVVIEHRYPDPTSEHANNDISNNLPDSSKEYETEKSSRCETPLMPISNDPSSYHLFKKGCSPGYFKMFNKKPGQKSWPVKSPKIKGNFWKKKPKAKDSLDELREPILDMIKAITKRFSKNSIEHNEKKRLKDIISALSYLLDTDESGNALNNSGSRPGTRNTSANTSRASLPRRVDQITGTLNSVRNSDCRLVMSDIQLFPDKEIQIKDVAPNDPFNQNKETCGKYCRAMNNMGMTQESNYNNNVAAVFPHGSSGHHSCARDCCNVHNAIQSPKQDTLKQDPPKDIRKQDTPRTDYSGNSISDKSLKSNKNAEIEQVAKIPLGEDLIVKIRCKKTRKPTHKRDPPTDSLGQRRDTTPKYPNNYNEGSASKTEAREPGSSNIYISSPKNTFKAKSSTDDGNTCSTDSATYKIVSNIEKQCDKYRHKRSNAHKHYPTCDLCCSNTSNICNSCKRVHYCYSNSKGHKFSKQTNNVNKKKSIAYNLILKASDSISEDNISDRHIKQLKNIVVKVPSKRKPMANLPFNELSSKIQKNSTQVLSYEEIRPDIKHKNDASSVESLVKHTEMFTVRKYLEKNRPEFVDKSRQRQNCIKLISEKRASQREAQRQLLSLHVDNREALSNLNMDQLRMLAEDLGIDFKKKDKPKFIRENEMKKHSERIYKTLPEVTQKQEQQKKDNIKKTNLLMADIFKKNLQKKTLQGNVNLSNYSAVLKL